MGKKAAKPVEEPGGVSTVGKALEILDLISEIGRPVRFKELELASRFPKPTLYRFVQTLTDHGMLNFDPDRNVYFLGIRLVRLAHAAWRQSILTTVAQPHLDELAQDLGESVYLSKLDGGHCVWLARGSPTGPTDMFMEPNRVFASYCTGVGKAMLAHLHGEDLDRALAQQSYHPFTNATIGDEATLVAEFPTTRKNGYATEIEEHVRGILCVAVPILSTGGQLLGGLGIHAPDRRTDMNTLRGFVPDMQATARRIATDAEIWSFPESTKAPTTGESQ